MVLICSTTSNLAPTPCRPSSQALQANSRKGVLVQTRGDVTVNFSLKPGAVVETIDVSAPTLDVLRGAIDDFEFDAALSQLNQIAEQLKSKA